MREVADSLGLDFHVVDTNLRELTDPLARWEVYCGSALATVALFLGPRFERIMVAKEADYEVEAPLGVSRFVNNLWSTEQLEVAEDGGRYSRVERTARIASHSVVQRSLRVCWENPDGAYNCGRCMKCLLTMASLEVEGKRSLVETFPPELDHQGIAGVMIPRPLQLSFWEDVLDAVRAAARADLEPAVETAVDGGKRRLGLPRNYRRRNLPGPPPLRPSAPATGPRHVPIEVLNAEARETLRTVLDSRSWKLTAPLRRLGSRLDHRA
jgi:hypothetical protein